MVIELNEPICKKILSMPCIPNRQSISFLSLTYLCFFLNNWMTGVQRLLHLRGKKLPSWESQAQLPICEYCLNTWSRPPAHSGNFNSSTLLGSSVLLCFVIVVYMVNIWAKLTAFQLLLFPLSSYLFSNKELIYIFCLQVTGGLYAIEMPELNYWR